MNRKAFFLVLAVFLLGVTLGAVGFYVANERIAANSPAANESRHNGGKRKGNLVERLTQELSLSVEQQQKVGAVLDETRRKYDATYSTIRPQMETIRQEGRQNIRAVLTPDQQAGFEAYLQRVDQERARMEQERKTNAK